jgi:hypothetical protein
MNKYEQVVERLETLKTECDTEGLSENFTIIMTKDFYESMIECQQWRNESLDKFLQWNLEVNCDLIGECFTIINQRRKK